ncbi:N-acetyl-gamma-glutamyl-phosphate reductase [Rickettsiales bacterium]|nr:N-acetyl-gamma-glutamyl-phosphate reductase [Rickettsiales bacterium]
MGNENKNINAVIIGASGYTGVELLRILLNHPFVNIVNLVAESSAGKKIDEIYPHLRGYDLPVIIKLSEISWENIDVAFCCLPHATSQEVIKLLPENIKIIDLSADFRLYDPKTYEQWYGHPHLAPELQEEAVYGLTELFRKTIKESRLVACPGCYPTSALLPLIPLLKNNLISPENIIIDSKSGVTGAGRSAKQTNLFTEVNEGVKAYAVCQHRHMPEIEQILSAVSDDDITVTFSPHLVPMSRGIISTIYVNTQKDVTDTDIKNALIERYNEEEFIDIRDDGILPNTRDVHGTNKCIISVCKGRSANQVVIVSVIDNLAKGSSGQAVQNMNVMFGYPEKTALEFVPTFP